ncbi:MAG: TauD/TfdA family dioxygenase [Alphaproteobacteria bacterium]|jgi:alpha-ketoglutarate-dependent taurine dioxygenase
MADQPRFDGDTLDREFTSITVAPMTLTIGAEVSGVDLGQPLSAEQHAEIRRAWVKWKVLCFRGQHLDHAGHSAFARQFGEPTVGHPVFGHDDDYPEIYSVAKLRRGNTLYQGKPMLTPWSFWHADLTCAINPPVGSMLRGDIVPPYGGDTHWTDLAAAYRGLSETMRDIVDRLDAIHSFEVPAGDGAAAEYAESLRQRTMTTRHPLVRVHPESGERSLYLSPSFVRRIDGLHPRESQKLLELLWEHAVRPEYVARFRWQPGDIAFWDNRTTAHLAPLDILDSEFDRQLYRITLVGEVPVGVDGRTSQAIEGRPILSVAEEFAAA